MTTFASTGRSNLVNSRQNSRAASGYYKLFSYLLGEPCFFEIGLKNSAYKFTKIVRGLGFLIRRPCYITFLDLLG